MTERQRQNLAQLVLWAVKEIRELDELCRSMVPGYAPLDSDDMGRLAELTVESKLMEAKDD
jgi:hypothetical protein